MLIRRSPAQHQIRQEIWELAEDSMLCCEVFDLSSWQIAECLGEAIVNVFGEGKGG